MSEITTLSESAARLHRACSLLGIQGPTAIAEAISQSPQMVKNWDSRGISEGGALLLQRALNINATWLSHGEGAMFVVGSSAPPTVPGFNPPMVPGGDDPPAPQYARLPVMGRAAAGTGQEAMSEHIATMDVFTPWFRRVYGRSPSGVSLLTAKGGSMAGVVEDGDVMFVVPVHQFSDDGIYIVAIGDLLRVKRLKLRIDGTLSIESTDGSAPELIPLGAVGETLRVQGRVIGSLGVRKHG